MTNPFSKKIPLILLILLLPAILSAQNDSLRLNKYFLKKCWSDTKGIVTSPVRWKKNDWQRVAIFTASTGALLFADEPVHDWMKNQQSSSLDKVSKNVFEPFGAEYSLATCGLLYGYGLLAKNRKSESTALMAAESFVLASLLVRIPKNLVGRERPNSGADAFEFRGPLKGASFPSGHTIAVFSVASVIANQYRETVWVPILSYSIAGLAGVSRIYDDRHWTSDVFAGAVLGIAVGNFVSQRKKESKLSVFPTRIGTTYGVQLVYNL